jgi:hypothetical protein
MDFVKGRVTSGRHYEYLAFTMKSLFLLVVTDIVAGGIQSTRDSLVATLPPEQEESEQKGEQTACVFIIRLCLCGTG